MATDNYSQFDEIRPFNPSELPAVYDRLLASEQFRKVLTYLYPGVDMQTIAGMMHRCRTNLEFQKALCYPFLEQLLAKASHGCDMDASAIDSGKRYTFVSNHRDIVLDSALLDKMLIDNGFTTTCHRRQPAVTALGKGFGQGEQVFHRGEKSATKADAHGKQEAVGIHASCYF